MAFRPSWWDAKLTQVPQRRNKMRDYALEARVDKLERRLNELATSREAEASAPKGVVTFQPSSYRGSRSIYVMVDGEKVGRIRRQGGTARPPSNGESVGFSFRDEGQTLSIDQLDAILNHMQEVEE